MTASVATRCTPWPRWRPNQGPSCATRDLTDSDRSPAFCATILNPSREDYKSRTKCKAFLSNFHHGRTSGGHQGRRARRMVAAPAAAEYWPTAQTSSRSSHRLRPARMFVACLVVRRIPRSRWTTGPSADHADSRRRMAAIPRSNCSPTLTLLDECQAPRVVTPCSTTQRAQTIRVCLRLITGTT